ncbi:MAG TPA: Npt1/Npt2 family nucleotide transporter [Bryobacteraceae bacterium]|jgi:AAA family ATP:ADP antiporter
MAQRKNALERFLSLAADVRPGEGVGVVLLAINVFVLLASYYLLKDVREALILAESGAEVKSYSAAGQALLLLLVVPLYGALTSRMSRIKVITFVILFFAANLALFYSFGAGGAHEGIPFYIWVGIFNNFAVAQFWSFANDLYSPEQGKRLFPVIGVGSTTGAVVGAKLAGPYVKAAGPYPLMLTAAAGILVCLFLFHIVHRQSAARGREFTSGPADAPLAKTGAFSLMRRDRYLLLIAVLIVLLNLVNTSGEYIFGKFVTNAATAAAGADVAAKEKFIGGVYGNYFFWTNLAGVLIQTFAVSRIFRYLGVGGALLIAPFFSFGFYTTFLLAPVIGLVRTGKILENGIDYSLTNTTRQALWLPTSREAKYKVKSAIDTFFVRFGDVLQGGLVYVCTALAIGLTGFATVVVAMTLGWLGVAEALRREHRRRVDSAGAKAAAD